MVDYCIEIITPGTVVRVSLYVRNLAPVSLFIKEVLVRPMLVSFIIYMYYTTETKGCAVSISTSRCSGWFPVEQVIRQGCVLAPHLFNTFFTAVIHVALTRFEADKDTTDTLVSLRKKPGASIRTARDPAPATSPWGMIYADDAAVVSQSPEHLTKVMVVIVTVCEAFGLTVSETKTEKIVFANEGNAWCRHHIQRCSA